jgi:hypothetical protein
MSRSKSRWKGALLAGAAMAVISPLAASAQTGMTLSITANPLGGGTSPNVYSGKSSVYIDPYDTDTLYVYATVQGTAAPSASYVDGLEYVYFNVNAVATGSTAAIGKISAASPSALFGGGAFNQTTTSPGAGAQGGALGTISTTPSIVVGSNNSYGSMAKPRSAGNVFSTGTSSGSNIVVSGNSVSFLVETLTYTPSGNASNYQSVASSPGSVNSLAFNVSTPSASLFAPATQYYGSDYFVGLPTVPGLGVSPGVSNTSSGYSASASNVTLTDALLGDQNLNGTVDINDFNLFAPNFGSHITGWTNGDFNDDGVVDINDFNLLAPNFGASLGSSPSGLAGSTALIGSLPGGSSVPEPASFGIISLGTVVLSSRRRVKRRTV